MCTQNVNTRTRFKHMMPHDGIEMRPSLLQRGVHASTAASPPPLHHSKLGPAHWERGDKFITCHAHEVYSIYYARMHTHIYYMYTFLTCQNLCKFAFVCPCVLVLHFWSVRMRLVARLHVSLCIRALNGDDRCGARVPECVSYALGSGPI